MSSYAFFAQACQEEHKKKHPDASVNFSEFSKKCSERWKTMFAKEKGKFEDMAKGVVKTGKSKKNEEEEDEEDEEDEEEEDEKDEDDDE
ncbi:High mobility group protein B1 [Tupaia chinensis]|uniref:High mobility group protein B1 n=1 Tax=Tupaia chinensis TaxID=246437 RepID=L9LFM4_TUPCH|nr:High mobility group protein B1 [Tupaia chinensis]